MPRPRVAPPEGARVSSVRHRVPFYETDAMGIVHHANHVRWLELARVVWMDEHDRPYRLYLAEGTHFATTRVEVDYLGAARFDDEVEIETWLAAVGRVSLRMDYRVRCRGLPVAAASTGHAFVDDAGRPKRLARERLEALRALAPAEGRGGRGRADRAPS